MLLQLLELFLAVARGPLEFLELLHLMNDKRAVAVCVQFMLLEFFLQRTVFNS